MTQVDRVLAALSRAGDHGITAVDFAAPTTCDGGPPIMRVAARVMELRDAGFDVVTDGERHGCAVYKLAPGGQLFTLPAKAPPNGMWDDAA